MTAGLHIPTRMRRTRATGWSRALHGETVLTPADLIWPLFMTAGDVEEPIATLPGVSRWPVKEIAKRAKEARDLGIPCVALFPNTPRDLRTDDGREALNPDNLMCRAIKAIKDAVPDIGVLTDVALDPYTAHGHDGLVDTKGYVLNDATVEVLVGQSLNQAQAGADIIAPSDMMDGRIGALRAMPWKARCLPGHVLIMSLRRQVRLAPSMVRIATPCGWGRNSRAARATRRPIRWTRPTPKRRCARSRSIWKRARTASWSSRACPISTSWFA